MQREARSMAIETDKKSAAVPKSTVNVNAAEKNIDPSIKKDAPKN
jgi:hypothetical protein